MTTLKTFLHYFYHAIMGFSIFAVFAFSMAWLYYNFLDGYTLPRVTEPIPILNANHEIAIGEPIVMQLKIHKPEIIAVEDNVVSITCDDNNLVTLRPADQAGTLPIGYHDFPSSNYELPNKVTVGAMCEFNFVNTYHINPYVEETVVWTSEQFKVVE